MADREEEEYRGWRVVEGPGTESTDSEQPSDERELGKSPMLGAGYGASSGGVEGDPGMPGPALGEIPDHTGPNAIAGIKLLSPEEEID